MSLLLPNSHLLLPVLSRFGFFVSLSDLYYPTLAALDGKNISLLRQKRLSLFAIVIVSDGHLLLYLECPTKNFLDQITITQSFRTEIIKIFSSLPLCFDRACSWLAALLVVSIRGFPHSALCTPWFPSSPSLHHLNILDPGPSLVVHNSC